jgi:hypothetical protein
VPGPEVFDALGRLGALGLALIAIWGFASGRVRVGKLVDDDKAAVAAERDDWKARALASDARLDRIATAFLKATGTAAPE